MTYPRFMPLEEIESTAERLLFQFDPECLRTPTQIEPYKVVEKCLGVPYDWKCLSPQCDILGMTTFNDGYIQVWEKDDFGNLSPKVCFYPKGSIIIDSSVAGLTIQGRERFTVIHEVFHQILHKEFFQALGVNAQMNVSAIFTPPPRRPMTPLECCEYQANNCAAAFLMPRNVVRSLFAEMIKNTQSDPSSFRLVEEIIKKLSDRFGVSGTAALYRLKNLQLITL